MVKELHLRHAELSNKTLNSIYFGGGTPSLLSPKELDYIFEAIYAYFKVAKDAEITLEANPDDIQTPKLAYYKTTPINRFSMGVQSFFDEDLRWMNRAHQAEEAEYALKLIQDTGFSKITIDLIYGGPTLSHAHWEANLEKAVGLNLKHISAYCLTAEPKTQLYNHISQGIHPPLEEEKAVQQFEFLVTYLTAQGFEQYEISNFAADQQYAVHNTNYWRNMPYLGIGPSAHSFNGKSRSWNIANNQKYMKALLGNETCFEEELLTVENIVNEYLMTGLRTMWGCSWQELEVRSGMQLRSHLTQLLVPYVNNQQVIVTETGFKLTPSGRLMADGIASDLFI